MSIILLLIVTIVLTHCDITDIKSPVKVSFLQKHFSGTTIAKMDGLGHSEEQQQEINQKKEIEASKDYDKKLGKSDLKTISERSITRNHLKNDINLAGSKGAQIFKEIKRGSRTKRQVLRDHRYPTTIWQDGVFYTFNTSEYIVQKLFKMGAKIWSDATCIDFVEDRSARDKLVVAKGVKSFSAVGRLGGDQFLGLDQNYLTLWSAVHEIGHALGFFHTMQRFDRDNYITIFTQNLNPHYMTQFAIMNTTIASVYGMPYDYGSIMHYGELSGSLNNQPTIIAIEAYYQKTMGSEVIAFSDTFMINEHYGCNEKCKRTTSAKCANGGYPHPRNCSICICPGGYGGALCDRRPPGCGQDLVATSEKQTVVYEIGSGFDLRDEFSFCNFMITTTGGKKIEVQVQSISHGYDIPGCRNGGVEVKAQKDQKLTGYRFCSVNGSKGPILSSYNRVPVIVFNRYQKMQVSFTYRLVY